MEELAQSRTASFLTFLAGLYVALSPIWLFMEGGQAATAIATGSVIGIAALIQMAVKNAVPSWVNIVAAVWLFISAFLFGASSAVMWTEIIAAVVVFFLSAWDGSEMARFNQRQHTHPAH